MTRLAKLIEGQPMRISRAIASIVALLVLSSGCGKLGVRLVDASATPESGWPPTSVTRGPQSPEAIDSLISTGEPKDPATFQIEGVSGISFLNPSKTITCKIGPVSRAADASDGKGGTRGETEMQASCMIVQPPEIQLEDSKDCGPIGNVPGEIWVSASGNGYGSCRGGVNDFEMWWDNRDDGKEGDSIYDKMRVLEYGETVTSQGVSCASMEDGIQCGFNESGRGFMIRHNSYEFKLSATNQGE